jgi:hypothetical protein
LIPAISIVLSFFIVGSPRWLLIQNKREKALAALCRLRDLSLSCRYDGKSHYTLHVSTTPNLPADLSSRTDVNDLPPEFPDIRVDLPWSDLFAEGIGINTTDMLEFFS